MNYRFIPVLLCFVTAACLSERPTALHAQVDSTLSCQDNPDQDYRTIMITRNDHFAIATHHDRLTAWELASGKQVYSLKKETSDVVYDKTANRVLFTDGEGNELLELVIDASPAEWTVRTVLGGVQDHQPLAISPDGHYLAVRIEYDYFGIWDLTTKKLVLQNKLEEVQQADFSPDGNLVALAFDRGENAVVTYSVPDGQQVACSASFLSSARRLAYSPDGKALAVTCVMGGDESLVVLDVENLRPIRGAQFPIHVYPVDCAVSWSGDGKYLAASGVENSENTIGVYDVQNKNRLVLLRGYSADSLAMNADGSRIASVTADEPGVVWWDWQAALRFRGPRNSVASHPRLDAPRDENSVDFRLQFSPDGKSLALAMPMPDEYGVRKPLQPTDEPGLKPDFDLVYWMTRRPISSCSMQRTVKRPRPCFPWCQSSRMAITTSAERCLTALSFHPMAKRSPVCFAKVRNRPGTWSYGTLLESGPACEC